jgi:hypothetical protein
LESWRQRTIPLELFLKARRQVVATLGKSGRQVGVAAPEVVVNKTAVARAEVDASFAGYVVLNLATLIVTVVVFNLFVLALSLTLPVTVSLPLC